MRDTVAGIARLVHPFPSILTALLTVALAAMAGGDPGTVVRLGLAMLGIQFAIGAINDLADADRDAGTKGSKPIPGGQVSLASARILGVVALVTGLALAASVNRGALALAALGAGVGIVYDLRLKGTPVSWLPFAVGIPLLPVFAWLGASGTIPAAILVATVVAFPAGAALALANELPDIERDERAGLATLSQMLGRRAAWAVGATLHAVVGLSAAVGFQVLEGRADLWPALLAALGLLGVGVLLGAGVSVARRQRAWEVQAIAIGVLAAVWLAAVPPALTCCRVAAGAAIRTRAGRDLLVLARLAAADHRDDVLQAQLGDREVLRQVRPIRHPDRVQDILGLQDADELLDGIGELLLGRDERLVGQGRPRARAGPAVRVRIRGGGRLRGDLVGDRLGRRAGPSTLDPLPELDQRKLAPGDLFGQPAALLRVGDLEQLVRVGERVFAQGHQLANLGRRVGEPEPVLEIALVLAELLG